MQTNDQLLAAKLAAFNRHSGPRVGDFLRLPRVDPRAPEFTRFTHDWDDHLQTGGMSGSYYLSYGSMSYSGGLDPGVATADLIPTAETKDGRIWFFDKDIPGAGRGVYFSIPCRVFELRPGASVSGLYDMECPYHLCYHAIPSPNHYTWSVINRGSPHTAFRTLPELQGWLVRENLALAKAPEQSQAILWPAQVAA